MNNINEFIAREYASIYERTSRKMNDINENFENEDFKVILEGDVPEDFVESIPIGIHERNPYKREQIELKREISTQEFLLEELKRKEASLQKELLKINEEIVNQSVAFITEDSFENFVLLRNKVERKTELEEEIQFLSEDIILKSQYIETLSLRVLIKKIEDEINDIKIELEDCGNDVTPVDLDMLEFYMDDLIKRRIKCLNTLRS